MRFEGNRASGSGAAIFVVYPSSNFVLPILNRGCFIQYFAENILTDLPPDQWVCIYCVRFDIAGSLSLSCVVQKTTIEFVNNHADSGGSAIFANDLGRCQWLNIPDLARDTYIFNPPEGTNTPFNLTYVMANKYLLHIYYNTRSATYSYTVVKMVCIYIGLSNLTIYQ